LRWWPQAPAVAGTADALTGGNYMYLRHAPESPTLLSLLGPWPWYIAGAAVIALALVALLSLPFRLVASRHRDVDLSRAGSS